MHRLFWLPLVAALAACSTPTPTGLLAHEPELAPTRNLDGVWCAAAASSGPFARAALRSVEPRGITDQNGVTVAQAIEWLRAPLQVPTPGAASPDAGEPDVAIDLFLTEMTPGSVSARFWAAELGAGHARVQVAGRFVAVGSGALLCEFVQRTNASGAIGLRDLGGDSGPAMVREMLEMVAKAIRQEALERLGATIQ